MDKKKLLALWLVMGLGTGCLESLEKGMDRNVPPTADAGKNQTVASDGEEVTVTLDGSGSSDPDGKVVEFFWRGFENRGSDDIDVVDGGTLDGGTLDGASANGNLNDAGYIDAAGDEVIDAAGDEVIDAAEDAVIDDAEVADGSAPNQDAGEESVGDSGVGSGGGVEDPASAAPNPDGVARPKVKLGKGSYIFVLWVTDNNGAVSDPDTVEITVE